MRRPHETRAACAVRSGDPAAGFTLVELVVVIGIIILATGFIVPSLSKFFRHRQLSNAGTLISNILNEAKNEAVTRKKPVDIIFLKKGMRIYSGAQKQWDGGLRLYDPTGRADLFVELGFIKYSQDQIRDTVIDEEKGPVKPTGLADSGSELDGDVSLRFQPDGRIDFRPHKDVGSDRFERENPSADIEIRQKRNANFAGFIDIRPQGRIVFKVVELTK